MTALAERLDPENLAAVVGILHNAVRFEVERREGMVGAFIGDGADVLAPPSSPHAGDAVFGGDGEGLHLQRDESS